MKGVLLLLLSYTFIVVGVGGEENEESLLLSGRSEQDSQEKITQLEFGETIKFDELGPIIITEEGKMRRIENWEQLSEREKETARRRIGERVEERGSWKSAKAL